MGKPRFFITGYSTPRNKLSSTIGASTIAVNPKQIRSHKVPVFWSICITICCSGTWEIHVMSTAESQFSARVAGIIARLAVRPHTTARFHSRFSPINSRQLNPCIFRTKWISIIPAPWKLTTPTMNA